MAETKETKKEETKKADGKKKGMSTKAKFSLAGIALILLMTLLNNFPSFSFGGSSASVDSRDVGVLTLTTGYPDNPMLEIDPNENCAQAMVSANVEWEQMINGVVVYRMPVGQPRINLVDPSTIGTITNMSFRIIEGQNVQTAELAYVKYSRTTTIPRGWFKAATQNQ